MQRLLGLLLVFGWASGANAAIQLRLMVWMPEIGGPRLVLPVLPDDTLESAAQRYLGAFNFDPELSNISAQGTFQLPTGTKAFLTDMLDRANPHVLVMANMTKHHYALPRGEDIVPLVRQLAQLGADVYLLPVVHDVGLSVAQKGDFHRLVLESFEGLIAMGGDGEVHRDLDGSPGPRAADSNIKLDRSEISMIHDYLAQPKPGAFFGICRGHQLFAVMNGAKMIRNIVDETHSPVNHADSWHEIKLAPQSRLFKILGAEKVSIRSYHYQAIKYPFPPNILVSAESIEPVPIIEALEYPKLRGYTVQFHPEFMFTADGTKMLKSMVAEAKQVRHERRKK